MFPIDTAAFALRDYDLAATLLSGQAFRWRQTAAGWEGVIGRRWVCLRAVDGQLQAAATAPAGDWQWLREYLQLDIDLEAILAQFPADDPHLERAIAACRGLRLLRQEPWETLASFICSANKRITQIRQMIGELCARFGRPIHTGWRQFPSAATLSRASLRELAACRLGYRASQLRETARLVAQGAFRLDSQKMTSYSSARNELMRLPGVGPKVADCVLLFAYGFAEAFPLDTWMIKSLDQLYFPGRHPGPAHLRAFITEHFAPQPGYAQQYLFHYVRTQGGLDEPATRVTRLQSTTPIPP